MSIFALLDVNVFMLDDLKLVDTYTTEEGTVNLYENGLLESLISEGAYIDVPYLLVGKARAEQVLRSKKCFVLTESTGHYRISKEARQLSASKEYSSHIGAVAVIVSNAAVKLVLELYLKIDKPVVPTKAFTKREDGIQWLLEQMKSK